MPIDYVKTSPSQMEGKIIKLLLEKMITEEVEYLDKHKH